MSNIASMGDAPDLDDDAADPVAVEALASRLALQALPSIQPDSRPRFIVGIAAELERERRKNPRRNGSLTPTPTPMPGVGTPPPRRDESCSPVTTTTATTSIEAAGPLQSEPVALASAAEPELSPERIAELHARADAKVDRALAKPPRVLRS